MSTPGGQLQHLYMTAHGEYTATNWVGEKAQIGIRLAQTSTSATPAKGSLFDLPTLHGDIVNESGTQAGTNGTLTKAWTARLGPVGSTENLDASRQIDYAEDFRTFLAAVAAKQYSGFRWTHIKLSPIRADGGYGAASAIYQLTTPIVGALTPALPPEVAVCVSYRAGIIGRRGRGRMYIPALADANETDGTVKSTVQTALKNAGATLASNLDNVAGTPSWGSVIAIMSAGKTTAVRPSEVRVGSHFDAQRRRQNALPEVYTSTAL